MMRTRSAILIPLCAALLSLGLLAGCGGGSSDDSSGASAADTKELTALAAQINTISQQKDAKSFCAILAPSQIDSTFHTRAKCTTEYSKIFSTIKDPPPATLTDISVDGDTAELTFKESTTPVTFIKEDGKWWLSGEQGGSSDNSSGSGSTSGSADTTKPGGGTKATVVK